MFMKLYWEVMAIFGWATVIGAAASEKSRLNLVATQLAVAFVMVAGIKALKQARIISYRRHWAYLKAVLRHKRFVFQECLKLGVPIWIAILHDWDKFLPDEWLPYARCFYKPDGSKQYDETPAFNKAWNHHQKRNKHHYQYWILTMDSGAVIPLPMPDVFRREMLANWRGAGRAYGNTDTKGWYLQRQAMFAEKLHPDTKAWIEQELGVA